MHEVALAESLIDLARGEAERAGASRIDKLIIEIGTLSHVDPHALRFAFETARLGSPVETAELEIEEPPGKAYCMTCEAVVPIEKRGDPCPVCHGSRLLVQAGEEMKLKAMEIA
jgi:hydrogenase nickel incorporation protein HypA/HybF